MKPISFIGVDLQKVNETIAELINLLGTNAPSSLENVKDISTNQFYNLKKGEVKKRYQSVVDELNGLDPSLIEQQNAEKYSLLVRHLNQIVEMKYSKNSTFRDLKMAENILYHLENNEDIKGFYCAHNMHVANFYNKKKQKGVAGGFLKDRLKEKYFSLGQEFYEGSFNVYFKENSKGSNNDGESYTFGSVTVGPAASGSLAHNFKKNYVLPLFIPFDQLPQEEEVNITNIGATYIIDNNPKSIWRYNHHGKGAFDAILLIDKSTPTNLLND